MKDIDPEVIKKLKIRARNDLYFFAKGICGFDWLTPDIHLPLCKLLEDPETNRRLKIKLPRGWLKTTLCSQAYPLWRAIRDSNIRCLLVQNTYGNAVSKLRTIKTIVESNEIFRMLFPELLPDKDCIWKSDSLCLKRPGYFNESTFEAAGTRTTVTSRHYNLIIEDDTVAPDLDDLTEDNVLPTKEDVAQAIGWHRLVAPLLVNPKSDQNLVVGTRWFEEDLLSWIEDHEKSFKHYNRACREDSEGNPDSKGEVAYPGRFDAQTLEELEDSLGPYLFSCLYLNMPIRSEDMTFKPDWIQYYETEPQNIIAYTSVDPASDPDEAKGKTDFAVVLTTGKDLDTGEIYILDYIRERMNPSQTISAIFRQVRKFHPVTVRVESVAYQNTLLYWIKERMRKENEFFMVEGVPCSKASKPAKIKGLQPVFANGVIFMRRWMTDLRNELLAFPIGKYDDVIDALSMQIAMWGATVIRNKREQMINDPMSLDYALDELKNRHKQPVGSVFDVFGDRRRILTWN